MTTSTLPDLSHAARALVAERPVFDAHVDSIQKALDLGQDLAVAGAGQLDLHRGRAGGLGSVVLVCWCDPAYLEDPNCDAFERTRRLLASSHELAGRRPDALALVGNGEELAAALGTWAMVFLGVTIVGASVLIGKRLGALFRV